MVSQRIISWVVAAFCASILSLATNAIISSQGMHPDQISQAEQNAWDQLRRDFPERNVYTTEELEQRSAAIKRIHQQFRDDRLEIREARLFEEKSVLRALMVTWIFWLIIPCVLKFPPRSTIYVLVVTALFWLLNLMLEIEVFVYTLSYFIGTIVATILAKRKNNAVRNSVDS